VEGRGAVGVDDVHGFQDGAQVAAGVRLTLDGGGQDLFLGQLVVVRHPGEAGGDARVLFEECQAPLVEKERT